MYRLTNANKINELDRNEQISLFSRLLEIVIRHAIKQKKEEKVVNIMDKQLALKPGSKMK